MLRWTSTVSRAVVELLGDDLVISQPQIRPLPLHRTAALLHHVGLYVALGHVHEILYVGMTDRFHTPSAIGARLGEHLSEPEKRDTWLSVVELPLREDLERHEVARHETRVGVLLGRPGGHRRGGGKREGTTPRL
ncbi:hypothetical protein ACH4MA_34020 [Streptomyces roseolus]|uniref:hypothetical protein n=1 Tax=Streptomyces roseolus TaxID=67358 RepID=UPI0037996A56